MRMQLSLLAFAVSAVLAQRPARIGPDGKPLLNRPVLEECQKRKFPKYSTITSSVSSFPKSDPFWVRSMESFSLDDITRFLGRENSTFCSIPRYRNLSHAMGRTQLLLVLAGALAQVWGLGLVQRTQLLPGQMHGLGQFWYHGRARALRRPRASRSVAIIIEHHSHERQWKGKYVSKDAVMTWCA